MYTYKASKNHENCNKTEGWRLHRPNKCSLAELGSRELSIGVLNYRIERDEKSKHQWN